jgi:hypothetical protein
MPTSRYSFAKILNDGLAIGSSNASTRVYKAVENGLIDVQIKILEEGERLDQIAGALYGSGELWWAIAAASGIGWGLQVAPGTRLRIPTDIGQVYSVLI